MREYAVIQAQQTEQIEGNIRALELSELIENE